MKSARVEQLLDEANRRLADAIPQLARAIVSNQ
jgi:hypothetical protein